MTTSPLYKTFETDKRLESEGIVFDLGLPNSQGLPMAIRIKRAGGANIQFAKVLDQKIRPVKRQSDAGMLSQERSEAILREVYAETVVIGFENLEDRDGNPLSFSKDNVVKLFTDLPDLFRDVVEFSQKSALFRAEVREADAGN